MILLSRALFGQDNVDEAVKTIAKMITDFPKSKHLDHAHYRHGEFSYAAEDYAEAIAEYDAVVTGWPDSEFAAYAKYGKGWAQLKSKAYAEATQTFTALTADHAEHKLVPEAYFARGMCRRQSGEQDGAITDINTYLASGPDLANKCDALYERGLAEVGVKKHVDAAATFSELLKADPKYSSADKVLYELAWALKSTGDNAKQEDAVANFAKLAVDYPDSALAAEANFHVGESHYEKKNYDEAAKSYTAAKAKNPAKELAEKTVYKLGWSLFQLEQYDAALAGFSEQLTGFPEGALRADALFMKAECLFRLENYEEALPAYKATQGVQLSSPTISVLALLHAGQSASQLKQWDEALAFLAQIPEKHAESPYLAEAHYELGWAKQNSGKEADAIKDYEQAAAKSRGAVGARARFMMGELQFGRKQYSEAIRSFQRAMYGYGGENAPADVKNWQAKSGYEAGRCADVQIKDAAPAARAGLIAEAKKYYQYVVEKHPQHELATQAQERLTELSKL
jgi:TolA-binding protein